VDLRDGSPVRAAVATLTQGETRIDAPLNDQGLSGDAAAGDGVFTGLVPSPAPGVYALSIAAIDGLGNRADISVAGEFEFKLAPPSAAR
jgi:hypothetical protein